MTIPFTLGRRKRRLVLGLSREEIVVEVGCHLAPKFKCATMVCWRDTVAKPSWLSKPVPSETAPRAAVHGSLDPTARRRRRQCAVKKKPVGVKPAVSRRRRTLASRFPTDGKRTMHDHFGFPHQPSRHQRVPTRRKRAPQEKSAPPKPRASEALVQQVIEPKLSAWLKTHPRPNSPDAFKS